MLIAEHTNEKNELLFKSHEVMSFLQTKKPFSH